ncbi:MULTISPECIES: tRNA (N(6)-L-threonylcarbamoyladenosine(37)-C(2))-methylthiotransferase MtaB [unclassified Helicobacter]|uniref:tRNA (N(6)-L-threonylcarbamoyladenosine(37)-C(2))- methylthiotransferase MtaB n=1 Tax=unclassified Helicobacter TaxID=2593540 RepID=UPI0009EF5799|nr:MULTISPECIES: tRNA (N(6)-L-threonylcarbamoyladenosine(37)-C(2))-methylthiotransferase MtaB [unclassified Helicobacter]
MTQQNLAPKLASKIVSDPVSDPASELASDLAPKPKVFFKTFGCRTNLYDTQVMRENLKDFEHTQEESEAQIIVVNSCTVTNGADSGVRSFVRRAKAQGKQIIFSGCGVKTQGKALFEKNLVQSVIGHSHKERINALLLRAQNGERVFADDALESKHIDSTIITEFVGKSRAFIKIQEGCDFACSYCIIPSVRGGARSFPLSHIITQARKLIDSGVCEVVLTGTNVGSYGKDLGISMPTLLRALFEIEGLERVRIGSLEPSQLDSEFFEILSHPKLERHLHIALQHAHDEMLSIMNRANRVESDFALLERLANLGYAIGTDFIVAHPGETQEIWEKAMQNVARLPLTHIHPFIYSVRDGTPSAKMHAKYPRINGVVAKERLHALNTLIAQKNLEFRERQLQSGAPLKVLIEKRLGNCLIGLDEFFNKIIIESSEVESKSDSRILDSATSASQNLSKWLLIDKYEAKEECNHAYI